MKKKISIGFKLLFFLLAFINCLFCSEQNSAQSKEQEFNFIKRRGDKLYDGNKEFRFISFNVPNFHIVEDPRDENGPAWHRITEYEQYDIVKTISVLGGQVLRMYTFSIVGGRNNTADLSHIKGIDPETNKPIFNEELFQDLDRGLKIAAEYRIRIIIPLVDNWEWFGGDKQWALLRGKKESDFYSDPQCLADFKYFISWLLNRRNTYTGILYKDDPTIFCWELGNELDQAPDKWLSDIAAYIKSIDPNHLIMDGQHQGYLFRKVSLQDPNLDILTYHYIYPLNNFVKQSKGKKPFILGEFFESKDNIVKVLDDVIKLGLSGALLWSLRFHSETGGFYYHSDFDGRSDSFQFPGSKPGKPLYENEVFKQVRKAAYKIQGLTEPPLPIPDPPKLLPILKCGFINWQGSVGASVYELQRASTREGPWQTLGANLTETAKTTHRTLQVEVPALPLFIDKTANTSSVYYYRLRAGNESGWSDWSEILEYRPQ